MRKTSTVALALLAWSACSTPVVERPDAQSADTAPTDTSPLADADTASPPSLTWSVVAEDYAPGALFSGWAGGTDNLWFVGGEKGESVVLRYDGAEWHSLDPGTNQQLWWVHGFEDGPVFVVGDAGAIARYEEGNWEQLPTHHPGVTLYGVWGATPDDVWAVGGPYAFAEDGHPNQGPGDESDRRTDVLLHFDGVAWSMVELPELPDRSVASQSLFKVWGTAADDVFIVGGGRLILHFDGVAWSVQDAGAGSQQLFTVVGRASDDVWAVGGGATGVLLHYDGATWSQIDLPPFSPQVLQGVWTAPGQPVHVSGFGGFGATWSGEAWTTWDLFTTNPLHGLVGDPSGALWAAGGNIMAMSPNYRGTLAVANRTVPPVDVEPAPEPEPDVTSDAAEVEGTTPEDAGPTPDSVEPGPEACDAPMTSCPEDVFDIFPGGPCVEGLACDYDVYEGLEIWYFTCEDGAFKMTFDCGDIGGSCGIVPSAEACLEPYEGGIVGADFDLSPLEAGEAFTPFEDGQMTAITWGGQGSPMLEVRLKLDGIETIECVSYQMTAELSAGTYAETAGTVTLRCGESLGMYIVLPMEVIDCDDSIFDLHLELMVEGFGTRTYDLQFQGGGGCWG